MNNEFDLKQELNDYKVITVEMIGSLEANNFEPLDNLLLKRQNIIDYISEQQYTGEEFAKVCSSIGLKELEERLNALMASKKNEAKLKMDSFVENKNANRKYNSKFSVDALYLNKKF